MENSGIFYLALTVAITGYATYMLSKSQHNALIRLKPDNITQINLLNKTRQISLMGFIAAPIISIIYNGFGLSIIIYIIAYLGGLLLSFLFTLILSLKPTWHLFRIIYFISIILLIIEIFS